ncbi:ABC transporter permease [Asanoa sp. NPDC049573]|uniref:ABC transporter permease n=1 Tax=Asanoa sp. NPDC049573 TaxID=3155396 RepID=UPI00342B44B3
MNTNVLVSELKIFYREPVTLPLAFALPVVVLVIFGVLPSDGPKTAELPTLAVTLVLAMLGFLLLPGALATYREKGVLRRMATTPVAPRALLQAQLAVYGAAALVGVVVVVVFGAVLLKMPVPVGETWTAAMVVLGTAAIFSLGLLPAALATSAKAATGVGFALYMPSAFFAGVYVPSAQLPGFARSIGQYTPLGAFRDALTSAWSGNTPDPSVLAIMVAWTVVCGLVAARTFRWE